MNLWTQLARVRRVRIVARSDERTAWTGAGDGDVAVASPRGGVLTFTESGSWEPASAGATRFRNVFRWTLVDPERIRLEHLRFGEARPVFLFDLAPGKEGSWRSVEPHVCGADRYRASIGGKHGALIVRWRVAGPRKEARIEYEYRGGEEAEPLPIRE